MAWARVVGTAGALGVNGGTTGAIDTTGATLIVVAIPRYTAGTASLTDSKSNGWTQISSRFNSGNDARLDMFYCANPTVGSGHTFTYGSGTVYAAILVEAWSGGAASPYDVENGYVNAGTTSPTQTGSITPTQDGELLFAGISNGATYSGLAIDESFTIQGQVAVSGGVNYGGAIATKIQTTAAAINPNWTFTGGLYPVGGIAAFKVFATPEPPHNLKVLSQAVHRAAYY